MGDDAAASSNVWQVWGNRCYAFGVRFVDDSIADDAVAELFWGWPERKIQEIVLWCRKCALVAVFLAE